MIDDPGRFITFTEIQKLQIIQAKRLDGLKYLLSTKYKISDLKALHAY